MNNSIQKLLKYCLVSTIIQNLYESNPDIRLSKQSDYRESCLNTFLAGLKEPIGSTIRAMRPTSLNDALNKCQEQNIYYLRNTSIGHQPPPKVEHKNNYNRSNNNQRNNNNFSRNNGFPNQRYNDNYNQNNNFRRNNGFHNPRYSNQYPPRDNN